MMMMMMIIIHQTIGKRTGGIGNWNWTWGDHPNYIIIKIGLNTEKSPKNLKRLTVTRSPVEDHLLTLVRKTLNK